jgi:hypothetical protein
MEFFKGYNNIRCNHDEFEFIKEYLWKDGWRWYSDTDDYNPDDLALISIKDRESKKILPYFLDEIEYIEPDKDVKEIIREIKLNELGI